jgi:type VI secretion system protein ImpA
MASLDKLLEPLAGVNPCGEDLWLKEGRFLLQQPVEQAWKNGEEPKWEDVRDLAAEQMKRSRDLRVAVILSLALFRTEGLTGFRDGVALIRGLVEKHWDHVYPMPEGSDDPVRGNTLSNLSAPLGNDTPYQFVKYLREAPLCRSAAGTSYSLADLDRADSGKASAATRDQIEAALRATAKDKIQETSGLVSNLLVEVESIESFVAGKTGVGSGVDLKNLKETLQQIIAELEPFADKKSPPPPARKCPHCGKEINVPSSPAPPPLKCPHCGQELNLVLPPPPTTVSVIGSRADADAALVAVCAYFRRSEPSSPVPLLLERARRLLNMDFMESMRDLAPPDAVQEFNSLFGIKEPEKPEAPSGS